jgi:hypothetical protein
LRLALAVRYDGRIVLTRALVLVSLLLAVFYPVPAGAEMYKLTAPDGTQH